MVVPDLNVLLYATNASAPQHRACQQWLTEAFAGPEPVGLSWQVLLGFLRLSTKAVIFARPLTTEAACDVINQWLQQPAAVIIHPTERHLELLRDLLMRVGTAGNLTTDAHLAALALAHGAKVVSCDSDFSRFAPLVRLNPLELAA